MVVIEAWKKNLLYSFDIALISQAKNLLESWPFSDDQELVALLNCCTPLALLKMSSWQSLRKKSNTIAGVGADNLLLFDNRGMSGQRGDDDDRVVVDDNR